MEIKNNNLTIIPKIEKYIEYMLTILLKLPRTEKFSIGTEIKTSMYDMLKYILLASKIEKEKRLELYNVVDSNIYYQRICIRIMYNNKWIDMKKYKHSNELLLEIGKLLGDVYNQMFKEILWNARKKANYYINRDEESEKDIDLFDFYDIAGAIGNLKYRR